MKSHGPKNDTSAQKHRIFVVDDHPIVRRGLAELINQQSDLMVCGEAEDGPGGLRGIESLRPSLALVDLSLKGMDGLELIKNIRLSCPDVAILVISMLDETLYAERALRAGAKGYVMKQEASEQLLTGIRKVLKGTIYLSDKMVGRLLQSALGTSQKQPQSPVELLSDRELNVFRLIGQGHGTATIAKELSLSVKTIETHRTHIKEKLQLSNASELGQFAAAWLSEEKRNG